MHVAMPAHAENPYRATDAYLASYAVTDSGACQLPPQLPVSYLPSDQFHTVDILHQNRQGRLEEA